MGWPVLLAITLVSQPRHILLVSYRPKPKPVSKIPVKLISGLTHVQSSHKGNPAIDEAQLLVMGPEQDHVVGASIESLECVARDLGEVGGPQVLETLDKAGQDLVASGDMVRVPKDLDVWVQRLEGVLGVLEGG